MPAADRLPFVSSPGTVVVKVGTNVLADASGTLDAVRIQSLADQIQRARAKGWRVMLVSSGAIGAGVGQLKLGSLPTDLPHLQACAAVGPHAPCGNYSTTTSTSSLIASPSSMIGTGRPEWSLNAVFGSMPVTL
jgi:glutamate 5-kinase